MEDNILGPGAPTAGKWMVYGQRKIKERILSDGIEFDPDQFYMHANHTDFQMEMITDKPKEKRKNEDSNNDLKEDTNKESHKKRFKPIKVATPGSYLNEIFDSSGDETI